MTVINRMIAKYYIRLATLISALVLLLSSTQALACPKVSNLIDFNCNQTIKIAFTGDSIVYGVGDSMNRNRGGYVRRLSQALPAVNFVNIGVRGITSDLLLRGFKKNLRKTPPGKTYIKSKETDILIIDVGRNDYWSRRPPAFTVRNIRRLVTFLRTELAKNSGSAPFIAVSTLLPTTREFQRPFIEEVNHQLLRLKSNGFYVGIHNEDIDPTLISSDGLHPSAAGYDAMAEIMRTFLTGDAQVTCSDRRPDLDNDGVYDLFEPLKFGTNPALADTDGDGLNDGEELFVRGTNPLVANAPSP